MSRDQSEDRPAPKYLVQYRHNPEGVSGYEVVRASDRERVTALPLTAVVATTAAAVLGRSAGAFSTPIKRAAKTPVYPQYNLRGAQINPTAMPGPSRA